MRILKRTIQELSGLALHLLHLFAIYCPYSPLKRGFYRLRGTRIGKKVDIAEFVFMEEFYPNLITIEDNVDLGPGVTILTHDSSLHNLDASIPIQTKEVVIKHNAYIGACSTILPGVTIGEYSIIGAGAVVTNDVPPRKIVAGVPARIIGDVDQKLEKFRNSIRE